MKRVTFNFTERAHDELKDISDAHDMPMVDVVRVGVGLMKVALEARVKGRKLMVCSSDSEPLQEVVLP